MTGTIGPLLPADEQLVHQIVDTFATVAQADLSWTEKVCAMAAARDGSLQVGFGIGKYPNRNVIDAYAGVSRGVGQWTVRGSRRLAPHADVTAVGPIRYEVVAPLESVRMVLEPTEAQPIAFDVTFEGAVPPFVEEREDWRTRSGFRHVADQIRYHQTGVARGWVEVDGERTIVSPDEWVSTRDHSWGVRPDVGVPMADLEPEERPDILSVLAVWSPVLMERPDGSRYVLHHYLRRIEVPDLYLDQRFQGGVEHPDGRKELFSALRPEIAFDPRTDASGAGAGSTRWPTARSGPSTSRSCPTRAFTSARVSTWASTACTTARGGAISLWRASTSPTAPIPRRHGGCTRSATASCESAILRAAAPGSATARPWCSAPGPASDSPPQRGPLCERERGAVR